MASSVVLDNLRLVSDWLQAKHPGAKFEIVVAGGAALLLLGVERTTYDVDVLLPEDLPPALREAAVAVARSRGLGIDWLNSAVARVLRQLSRHRPLPAYFAERSKNIALGDNLTVFVLGRQALISLKLLAASPSERKHTNDIKALTPTAEELRLAEAFVLSADNSPPRIEDLSVILDELRRQA